MVVRGAILALAAAVAAAAIGAAGASASGVQHRRTGLELTSLERGVLADINSFRREHGLVPLKLSPQLADAARQHSREMAADGYFAHDSYDGGVFWKRVQRYYSSGLFGFWSVGENLLWSSPSVTASGALELWEHSPEHLANLLAPRWREIGISAVHVDSAPGVYKGMPVTIVTADFGVRR
jgi:uncharacterized protein YkwD